MAIKVIFFDLGDTLVTRKDWLPSAKETLGKLKQAGISLGVISNTGNLIREKLLSDYLPDDFSFDWFEESMVLLSSEVGVEKPSLGIFNMAINHANVSPWETLFVAETIKETFAAQQAGMQAIRICDASVDLPKLLSLVQSND